MNKFVIDASAWIEYFDGTIKGEDVKKIVENSNNLIFTSVVTIAELSSHFIRRKYDFNGAKKIISSLSSFFSINVELAEEAGTLHASLKKERKNISLADILVLLTARKLKAKVVTDDEDFRGLKEAIMIK